jgi:hypothetical protein
MSKTMIGQSSLQSWSGANRVPGHLALDETIGARLGHIDLGVLAGVLDALVPAQV